MTASPHLRLGTLNVRTLAGRLGPVLALAHAHDCHVLCMQETRVPLDSRPAVASAARAAGWQTFFGEQGCDARGAVCGGTAIFTATPAHALEVPGAVAPTDRVVALKLARPQQRPLLLVNVYLHAADRFAAGHTLHSLFAWLAQTGEDCMIMGDFNLEASQWPISAALACGRWRSCDEDLLGSSIPGTHRAENGQATARCIDFALCTPHVCAFARNQARGLADHDLVSYDLRLDSQYDPVWAMPAAPPLVLAPVADEAWDHVWAPHRLSFQEAVAEGHVDAAWTFLSNAAEQALGCHPHRAARAGPQLRPAVSTKAPTFQTLRERQLRRTVRRLAEYQRRIDAPNPNTGALAAKLRRDLRSIDWVLLDYPLHHPHLLEVLECKANEAALAASQRRLEAWKAAVQEDVVKAAKWVQRTTPLPETNSEDTPVLPAARAQHEADAWSKVWNPTTLPSIPDVQALCLNLGGPADEIPLPDLKASQLSQLAQRGKNSAPGMDGWKCADLTHLPLQFWELVLTLWHACLTWAHVPSAWKRIRICLIPKPTGGLRPLAIASVMWRICMSATMRALRPWILRWAPPQLYGGVPDKHLVDFHARFHDDLADGPVIGCKADVRRCFDSVCPKAALEVWKCLGAPRQVLSLVSDFYTDQQRWFSWLGIYHPQPITIRRGLLQGCPGSVALLNGIMTVWVRYVQQQSPTAQLGVYLDDRTVWGCGLGGKTAVLEAMQAGQHVDLVFHLVLHPDKLQSFANRQPLLDQLAEHRDLLGCAVTRFLLLGLVYHLMTRCCIDPKDLTLKILERCRKIRLVARGRALRCKLLRMLVIPLFSWCGAWQRFYKATVVKWTLAVETTIWGRRPPPGRSRFLAWCSLGNLHLHPRLAMLLSAIRYEWGRQWALAHGRNAGHRACPGWRDVTALLHWEVNDAGAWKVPHGCRPGWALLKTVYLAAQQSFVRFLWQDDTKTEAGLPDHREPYLDFHIAVPDELDAYGRRVLCGAAVDTRTLQRVGVPAPCLCGDEEGTRSHRTFACPAQPWRHALRSADEQRLLMPLVARPVTRDYDDMKADPLLVAYLRQVPEARPLFAIDGSAQHGQAGWAVVAHHGPRLAAPVLGLDQTSHAGERSALLQLCLASSMAQKPVRILCDAQALVQRLHQGLAHGYWGGDLGGYWHTVRDHWLEGSCCVWIPAHGRCPRWRPPPDWPCPDMCRELNRLADTAARGTTTAFRAAFLARQRERSAAHSWASAAHEAQDRTTRPLYALFRDRLQRAASDQ